MNSAPTARDRWIWLASAALMAATLGTEMVVPLGYAVWLTYFMAVGITLFQRRMEVPLLVAIGSCILLAVGYNVAPSSSNSAFSFVNRSIGGVAFLMMALTVMKAISARREAADALWLQAGENVVGTSLQGDPTPRELADAAMRALCAQLNADVGAMYRLQGERLVLVGGAALPSQLPETLPAHTGQWGEIIREGRARRLEDSDSPLDIDTLLGRTTVHQRLLGPITADGVVIGVIELGRAGVSPARGLEMALLLQCAEPIGIALRAALLNAQLVELLEETQRQSEELQTQQEELRVANEELEEQSRSLLHSQANLEQQQAELEQTNEQLADQTQALAQQRDEMDLKNQRLHEVQLMLEERADELQRASRYKSEFLANMSHELRTPLNSSLILAKLLADNTSGNLSDEQVRFAQTIYSAGNDLLQLINDILDIEKLEAGRLPFHFARCEVLTLVEQALVDLKPYGDEYGVGLVLVTPNGAHLGEANLDPDRFAQVMANLLSNAIKHSPAGGVVSVDVRRHGDSLEIGVQDQGQGIPEDFRARIFERFAQADSSDARKRGGTGLGLAITRSLVQQMHGRIGFDSQQGQGTRFWLRLPVASTPSASPPTVAQALPQAGKNGPVERILVLEPDAAAAEQLATALQQHGYGTLIADTAAQAREMLAEFSIQALTLSPALSDEDSIAFLQNLRSQNAYRHLPVLIVSLQPQRRDNDDGALRGGAVGVIDWLHKPVDPSRVMEVVQACLRTNGARPRILHVEDDEDLRVLLARLVEPLAIDLHGASTLTEARHLIDEQHFDLAIIDLMLPDGDGSELFDQLAQSTPPPPVIIFSALDSPVHDSRLALRQLVKSRHDGDELAALIQQLLQTWPPSQTQISEEVNA